MPRISSERIFKSHYPKATCVRYSTSGGEIYYLVREEACAYSPCGEGDTKAQAWVNACERRGLTSVKEQP